MLEINPHWCGTHLYALSLLSHQTLPQVTFSRRHPHHPTTSDETLVNLNLSGKRCNSVYVRPSSSTSTSQANWQVLESSTSPLPDTHIQLNLRQLHSREKSLDIFGQKLENWHLRDTQRKKLIEFVVKRIGRALFSTTPSDRAGCSVMDLRLQIILVHSLRSPGFEFYDMIRMVPADERSIESLHEGNMVIVSSEGDHQCVICVDEISEGCQVVRMPCCSHDFHRDCIDKWLRTSHYCPLCRSELPTT